MKEGKLTLPVIYAVLKSDSDEWKQIAYKVRSRTATDDEIARLVRFTKESGGIEYAREKMEQIRSVAFQLVSMKLPIVCVVFSPKAFIIPAMAAIPVAAVRNWNSIITKS